MPDAEEGRAQLKLLCSTPPFATPQLLKPPRCTPDGVVPVRATARDTRNSSSYRSMFYQQKIPSKRRIEVLVQPLATDTKRGPRFFNLLAQEDTLIAGLTSAQQHIGGPRKVYTLPSARRTPTVPQQV